MFIKLVVLILTARTSYSKILHNKGLRIIGGTDGDYHKYPYIVRLEIKIMVPLGGTEHYFAALIMPRHSCTCTALTSTWTLTAAHCMPEEEHPAEMYIRYGSERPLDDNAVVVKVLVYKTHPSYKLYLINNTPIKIENDVAVLKTEPIIIPLYPRLSAIEYSSLFGQEAIACGFGLTNDTNDEQELIADTLTLNKQLQVINVMMMSCTAELLATMHPALCMARKCGNIASVCPGDSGGPLLHKSGVVGVVSLGVMFDCSFNKEKSNLVGVITPVSPFVEWIGNIINE